MFIIQTHDGKIHADEVSSVALLNNYFTKKGKNVSILRDSQNFEKSDILINVGLEYDHDKLRYDSNQINEFWDEQTKIPLSSIGLIWRHYGKEIIEMYLYPKIIEDEDVKEIWDKIYKKLIIELDAHKNGINLDNKTINISEIVEDINGDPKNDQEQNENFSIVVTLVSQIFDIKFKQIIKSYFDFQKDYDIISKMDFSEPYIIISTNIKTAFDCLDVLDPNQNVKFIIICDVNEFIIQTREIDKFISLHPIASENILKEKVSNPEEIIFVHKYKFIAKTKTLDTAKEIINISLNVKKDMNKFDNITKFLGGSVAASVLIGVLYWNNKEN